MSALTPAEPIEHEFQAEVAQVLSLVINSLYTNREIFLRELVSNASDALDKLRFSALTDPSLRSADHEPVIRLIPDAEAKTLTIWDNGIGMTEADAIENLGTVARSGSKAFLEQMKRTKDANGGESLQLIGQFGVGFYSAFLVADRVRVITRAVGADSAIVWESEGADRFTVAPAEREIHGTSVVIHLEDDYAEYLDEWRLRELVRRYSDYVSHPIQLAKHVPVMPAADENEDEAGVEANAEGASPEEPGEAKPEWETVNSANALWRRSASDITDEQYEEFFKHLNHAWESPLARTHFRIEGTQLFTALLFVPKTPPFDLFDAKGRRGLRLHVKRVLVMDDCEDLLPPWLRFIRGVVDSDDLPLNVSRETLQDSRTVRFIQKQVVKKSLEMLARFAKDSPDEYADFWRNFGSVLKEGIYLEPDQKGKLLELLRYHSSEEEGLVDLPGYVERMKEGQRAIYYATGPTLAILRTSPHLETLKARGYEVLLMPDTIDNWVMQTLREYKEWPLVSAMEPDLRLGPDDESSGEDGASDKDAHPELKPLRECFTSALAGQVNEVNVSQRLTDSPVCLVIPAGGLPSHIERLLAMQQQKLPPTKRILEINPTHPLITGLQALHAHDPDAEQVTEWIELLYEQALLTEGSPIDNPQRFASRMNRLLEGALKASLPAE